MDKHGVSEAKRVRVDSKKPRQKSQMVNRKQCPAKRAEMEAASIGRAQNCAQGRLDDRKSTRRSARLSGTNTVTSYV